MENKIDNNGQGIKKVPNQSIFQPSQILIDNWKFWMAYEVIEQWQQSSSNCLQLYKDINLVQKQVLVNSLNGLKSKILQKKEKAQTLKDFKVAESIIREYFQNNAIVEMNKLLFSSKSLNLKAIHRLISMNFHQLSPRGLAACISEIINTLKSHEHNFYQKKTSYLKQEKSALKAYFVLWQKLKLKNVTSNEYNLTVNSIWNSMSLYFESKLKVEYCIVQHETILNLIQYCQTYYNMVNRSSGILDSLQKSLKEKCTFDILSLPVFINLKRVDAKHQKSLIEVSIGHSINYWGNSSVSWQQIELQLLNNLNSVVLEVYIDFQHCFMEHSYFTKNAQIIGFAK